jgi:hypothetical protein
VVVAQACLGKPLVVLAALAALVLMAVPAQVLAVGLLVVVKVAVLMAVVLVVAAQLYTSAAPIHILLIAQALVVLFVLFGALAAVAEPHRFHQLT